MREILFRGKRKDNGEWVEGFYVIVGGKYHYILIGKLDITGGYPDLIKFAVDPATVGQFTGLTDKNGKRIFEGYIVESVFTKKPYIVCFGEYTYTDDWGDEQSACGWYNIEKGGYVTAFGIPDKWATVIGNIHDNPELLEEHHDNER